MLTLAATTLTVYCALAVVPNPALPSAMAAFVLSCITFALAARLLLAEWKWLRTQPRRTGQWTVGLAVLFCCVISACGVHAIYVNRVAADDATELRLSRDEALLRRILSSGRYESQEVIWQMRADRDGEPQLSRKLLDLAVERREFDLDIADDEPVIGSLDYDATHARWAKSKSMDAAVQFGAVIGSLLSASEKAGIRVPEGTLRRARGGGSTDPGFASDLASQAFRIERLAHRRPAR